jgi:hypothetical protein
MGSQSQTVERGAETRSLVPTGADALSTQHHAAAVADLGKFADITKSTKAQASPAMAQFDAHGGLAIVDAAAVGPQTGLRGASHSDRDSSGEKKPEEIKPANEDRYKTPVITPEQYQQGQYDSQNLPMDEHGRHMQDRSNKIGDEAFSMKGRDGKVNAVVSHDGDSTTTFNFDRTGKIVSRSLDDAKGKEVVKYDAHGKPISDDYTSTEPGAKPEPQKIDQNDTVTAVKGKDGKTTIVSKNGDETTTLNLDATGSVTDRAFKSPTVDWTSKLRPDGSVASETTKTLDKNGKLIKTVEENDDFAITTQKFADGSKMTMVENNDQSTRTIIQKPDGTQIDREFDGRDTDKTKITTPNGSVYESTDSPASLMITKRDKAGNWDFYKYDKRSGLSVTESGAAGSMVGDKTVEVPI